MYIILCVLFIICERCYGYEDVIDIPEITTEPTAMISRASGLKITLHCKWPRIQRSVTHQLVYANENVTLNSSTGNDLTYTLKSSCRNSGRYVCRSVGLSVEASEDRRLDFLITDCNPRMCSDSEYIKTVSASTGSQVAVTYCVIASEADVTVPQLRAFRTLGVRQSSLQDKINFTFTALSGISYELTVNICNVTVEDYGEVDLEIISLQRSLRFELKLLPIGALSQYINYTKKDQILSCRSSWYPCVVVISKGHSGQILNSVNNTIIKNEMVLLNATLPQATCGDMGVYKCVITDFRGVNVVKEIFVDPDE
uniref:Ig-like domain-containing protein n=1 Tax=Biomphalaria glabrata TaxID=6526 RepID=A0A2C9L259_BIOGL